MRTTTSNLCFGGPCRSTPRRLALSGSGLRRATRITMWLLPFCLFVVPPAAIAQQENCGPLTEVLQFGADETEISSTRDEARRLYRNVCDEQSRLNQRSDNASVNSPWKKSLR